MPKMQADVESYFRILADLPGRSVSTDRAGERLPMAGFIDAAIELTQEAAGRGHKLMFIGNGGSAAIASHMANDFAKNGGIPAMVFNDGAALTCLGNDLGFEQIFARQIELHGRPGDVLFAISSSGNSADIINGVKAAREAGCAVVGLSGFGPDNKLRRLGDLNFYVPSEEYGFVELMHQIVCHAVLDIAMGWTADTGLWRRKGAA